MKIHNKTEKCEICDKSFRDQYDLSNHQRGHFGEKPFKCNDCNMCFKLKKSLK